ncbi:MAG TPA: sodium:proton antiporter [Casimicrobiaceae bacterium]|nr:sodium:proton antiporter [Casimicrobiaceae bacterium]
MNGAALSPLWTVPFAGVLLSIALIPVTAPGFWHRHFGKTTAFWIAAFLVPFTVYYGPSAAAHELVHALLVEYVPFIVLLFALFTVSGGIHVRGNLHGSASLNTRLLALGTLLASVMGTTGAAMLLIRPLLRANDDRRHRAHVVVFFIFLVANVGGALTPLGDPPLFLGFLKGVDFFWTTRAMLLPTLTASGLLLVLFYVIDRWCWRRETEERPARRDPTPDRPLAVDGKVNFVLLAGVVALVLVSGVWKPDRSVVIYGTTVELSSVVRDVGLLAIAWASLRLTPPRIRHANEFDFGPIVEVAKLFAGIFVTIAPAIAMLRAGRDGLLAPLFALMTHADGTPNDALYFWMTGALSSFLDNAPTYLVFFTLAGGDAAQLAGPLASTLVALSAGAVFMGANTYIGNAPNFMVKSIAEARGVKMPSFFGYLGWSLLVLMPVYALLTLLFFI